MGAVQGTFRCSFLEASILPSFKGAKKRLWWVQLPSRQLETTEDFHGRKSRLELCKKTMMTSGKTAICTPDAASLSLCRASRRNFNRPGPENVVSETWGGAPISVRSCCRSCSLGVGNRRNWGGLCSQYLCSRAVSGLLGCSGRCGPKALHHYHTPTHQDRAGQPHSHPSWWMARTSAAHRLPSCRMGAANEWVT